MIWKIIVFLAFSAKISAAPFEIKELPLGTNITLLPHSRAVLGVEEKVELSPTGRPQTISIKLLTGEGPLEIGRGHTPLKTLDLRAGQVALYTFLDLEPIYVYAGSHLQAEIISDAPLTYAK